MVIGGLHGYRYQSLSSVYLHGLTGKAISLSIQIKKPNPVFICHTHSLRPRLYASETHHPWPEWITFVDRLKSLGYFPPSSAHIYGDISVLKDPCLTFARHRYHLFRSFPKDDIQSLVEGGCPLIQRKVVNSAKRLRLYVGLEEKSVCDICSLQGSCDRANVILGESEGVARMVDLMRLLLSYALDPRIISGAVNASSINQAESGSRRVLNVLINLTEASPEQTPSPRDLSRRRGHKKEQTLNNVKDSSQDTEKKKGDWTCPKCSSMNFSRNFRCWKCNEDNPRWGSVDVEMKKGDWKCLQCGVVNFASRRKCFGCKDPRPPEALNPGEWQCSKCYFVNFRRNTACLKCGSKRSKDAVAQQDRNDFFDSVNG